MLNLWRKFGETILFGDNRISITVLNIIDDVVLLGCSAPRDVRIHRKEKYLQMMAKQRELETSTALWVPEGQLKMR